MTAEQETWLFYSSLGRLVLAWGGSSPDPLPSQVVGHWQPFPLDLDSVSSGQSYHVQLCLTLCNPMDYSPPGSSIHGVF